MIRQSLDGHKKLPVKVSPRFAAAGLSPRSDSIELSSEVSVSRCSGPAQAHFLRWRGLLGPAAGSVDGHRQEPAAFSRNMLWARLWPLLKV